MHTHVCISIRHLSPATRHRLALPLSAADTCVCQATDSPPRTMTSDDTSLRSRSPSCVLWRHAVWRQDVCASLVSSRILVSEASQRQRAMSTIPVNRCAKLTHWRHILQLNACWNSRFRWYVQYFCMWACPASLYSSQSLNLNASHQSKTIILHDESWLCIFLLQWIVHLAFVNSVAYLHLRVISAVCGSLLIKTACSWAAQSPCIVRIIGCMAVGVICTPWRTYEWWMVHSAVINIHGSRFVFV